MPTDSLPTKLKKEPLVDAVFELRFSSTVAASNVIPGILLARLKKPPRMERLPAADIPTQIRALNPVFQAQPLIRIHWNDSFMILVGDAGLGLACKMPYPGWHNFKSHILELTELLTESQFIDQIDRYSLKYVGIVEGKDIAEQIGRIKLSLKLGSYILKAEPFTTRIEMQRGSILHIVSLAAPATAGLADGTQRQGMLVDIGGLCDHCDGPGSLDSFRGGIS
jgi:uncharacterized protein (TIGR04255 family)